MADDVAEMSSDLPAIEDLRPVPSVQMDHVLLVGNRPEACVALVPVQCPLLDALHAAKNGQLTTPVLMTFPFDSGRQMDILVVVFRWIAYIVLVVVYVEGAHPGSVCVRAGG